MPIVKKKQCFLICEFCEFFVYYPCDLVLPDIWFLDVFFHSSFYSIAYLPGNMTSVVYFSLLAYTFGIKRKIAFLGSGEVIQQLNAFDILPRSQMVAQKGGAQVPGHMTPLFGLHDQAYMFCTDIHVSKAVIYIKQYLRK